MLTQQKFPAGEIPLLRVNRGEKEEGLSPLVFQPPSAFILNPLQTDCCTEHHSAAYFVWHDICVCVCVCVRVHDMPHAAAVAPRLMRAVHKLRTFHQDPARSAGIEPKHRAMK